MITARGKIRDAAPTSRVMVVAILVLAVAFLDSTVVTLAPPAIKRDLGGGLATQQWVVDGYLLALAATTLPGGFIAGAVGATIITNPTVPAEPVSCEVAAMCRDRHDAHPHLAGHF